jgi:hypothetical protein
MATDTNETEGRDSANDQQDDEGVAGGNDEKSQEEMRADFEAEQQQQYAESRRKIGPYKLAATVVLIVIALGCFASGQSVTVPHPLVENGLYALGVANLAAALAFQFHANWSRTIVLVLMTATMVIIVLTFTNTTKSSLLVAVVCLVEIYLMFRQPILDEYDAPKE